MRTRKPLYIRIQTSSLKEIPHNNSEFLSDDLDNPEIRSAVDHQRQIRALFVSEGVFFGSATCTFTQLSGRALISFESVVVCPIKQIVEINGPEFVPEALSDGVHVLRNYEGELLWDIASDAAQRERYSLQKYSNYNDFYTLSRSPTHAVANPINPNAPAEDVILQVLCGVRPMVYESFRKHLLEVFEHPQGLTLLSRFLGRGMEGSDTVDFLEDILLNFHRFVDFYGSSEVFEDFVNVLSSYPALLKELYLIVESSLDNLLQSRRGIDIVVILIENLPDVGKKSLIQSLASQWTELSTHTHARDLMHQLFAKDGYKEMFREAKGVQS